MRPDAALVDRFRAALDALSEPDERIGVGVSGGPDSIALLLLAAAARPGLVEAATVDHALRTESRAEADFASSICAQLGIPHTTLSIQWRKKPETAIQERARDARYRLLGDWVADRKLSALAVAHHADDQAETMVMRLARGSGLRGLAGMRAEARIPGGDRPLLRPLLGWRRSELERICTAAGIQAVADPSNFDEQYERVRIRKAVAGAEWLDPQALAQSASHLASADDALDWAVQRLALARVTGDAEALRIDAQDLPVEIQRRLMLHAFARFHAPEPRGPDLSRALGILRSGGTATLSGLKLESGVAWRITKAPARRSISQTRPMDNFR